MWRHCGQQNKPTSLPGQPGVQVHLAELTSFNHRGLPQSQQNKLNSEQNLSADSAVTSVHNAWLFALTHMICDTTNSALFPDNS